MKTFEELLNEADRYYGYTRDGEMTELTKLTKEELLANLVDIFDNLNHFERRVVQAMDSVRECSWKNT